MLILEFASLLLILFTIYIAVRPRPGTRQIGIVVFLIGVGGLACTYSYNAGIVVGAADAFFAIAEQTGNTLADKPVTQYIAVHVGPYVAAIALMVAGAAAWAVGIRRKPD